MVATSPLETGSALGAAAVFFVRRSAAHEPGAAFGGDVFGVSSAPPLVSGVEVAATAASALFSSFSPAADLIDFCVVDVTLGAFAGLMGISGIAGLVCVRMCEP